MHLLGHKWTHERVDKASDETINKTYGEYKQCELNEKGEKSGKALGKYVIDLVKKLQQDIENDPIIKDQMANLDCLLVRTFGNFLAPVLVAAHMVNILDLGGESENEGYESDHKI